MLPNDRIIDPVHDCRDKNQLAKYSSETQTAAKRDALQEVLHERLQRSWNAG